MTSFRAAVLTTAVATITGVLLPATAMASPHRASDQPGRTTSHAPVRVHVTRDQYGTDDADTERIFAPARPGRYPAVLFVHGGAWGRSQPIAGEYTFGRMLAATQGWVVSVIGYPTKIANARTVEPAAVRAALVALAHRADTARSDIGIWGESAGGHLALLTAYRDAEKARPIVRGVVSVSGPTDMLAEFGSLAQTALSAVTNFEGLDPAAAASANSSRYANTSPVDLVQGNDPATFQAISKHDPLVLPDEVTELARILRLNHVKHQTVRVPGDGHSTPIETQKPAGSKETVEQLAASFLGREFAPSRSA